MWLDVIYVTAIFFSLPYLLLKIFTNKKYRTGLLQRLGFINKREIKKPCLWIHGSSVGEILTCKTLIEAIEGYFQDIDIVVSTCTNTGFSTAIKNFSKKYVFYFPLDISWIAKRVLKKIRPDCVILIELEIWPNFFITAFKKKIPILLVNGRISERSVRFYRKLCFFSKIFHKSLINNIYCARTETDASRFRQLGIPQENIPITGTMKYDNIVTEDNKDVTEYLKNLFQINSNDTVIVGGSTHKGEEEILIKVFKDLKKENHGLRLIIVPRHIERTPEIISLIENMGFLAFRKTSLESKVKDKPNEKLKEGIIVIDTIGDLINIYGIADCVFVGKSLVPYGGQNIMEPAGLAKPIIFGPHTFNFMEETNLLLKNDAARLVKDEKELLSTIRYLLKNPVEAGAIGTRAQKIVIESKGATNRNMEILKEMLCKGSRYKY